MRRSEFNRAVQDEFGPRAATVLNDLFLDRIGGGSAREALDAGIAPRDIWLALCAEMDVPEPPLRRRAARTTQEVVAQLRSINPSLV